MAAEHIDLEPVQSSNLAAIGYNPTKQILAVEFKSGAIFHYAPFAEPDFREFCQALSLGQWYAMHVKGKIPGQKMTGHCPKCGAQGWIAETCPDCGCADVVDDGRKQPETAAPF